MSAAESNVEPLVQNAAQALGSGQLESAEAMCREALRLSPKHQGALAFLGAALLGRSRFGEAEEIFNGLALQQPDESAHWINLGNARRGLQRFDAAIDAFARAAALGERSADFFYNVGLAHLDRADFESARAVLAEAASQQPRDAPIRYAQALACHESLQPDGALAALADWRNFDDLDQELLADIAQLLMNLGANADAEEALARLMLDPAPTLRAALTIVQILERLNRMPQANALLEKIVADQGAANLGQELLMTRASMAQRNGDAEAARRLLVQAVAGVREWPERHRQLFPLAKALDSLGRYDEALEVLAEAHGSQAQYFAKAMPGIAIRGAPMMVITRLRSSAEDIAAWDHRGAPGAADSPIFVVAYPRSGTTLLELTLDAHPSLRSMDEQPFIQNALEDLVACGAKYPHELAGLTAAQLEDVRQKYWARVKTRVTLRPGQRLVDKNPLNILRLAVIRRLFPNAKVVLAVRHPFDVILSCYMQHFRAPDFALICRDLPSLASAYAKTLEYWYAEAELLQPQVREVRYETLVEQFEPEVRALADFLELPWNDALLSPQQNAQRKGFISTPSYAQVVKPVHRGSVDRWRRYAAAFAPLEPIVAQQLQRWGYVVGGDAPAGAGSVNSR